MKYVFICARCGTAIFSESDGVKCTKCAGDTINSGYTADAWNSLSYEERDKLKKECIGIVASKSIEEHKKIEREKQEYANSFNEYYEYDVVTIINADHGRIDREKMMSILATHAKEGWKLHSIYSNELGKNAVRVLGFGVNSTACEDVLIFERRIRTLE